jgi:TetR/AcrR family transcriptional regulator, transcriptional repressor for nem operon
MARASKAAKALNHEKIVAIAARLIKSKGVEGLNLSDAMKSAGLTHGGFYRHFKNKNELVQEAIRVAFHKFSQQLRDDLATFPPDEALARFVARYLSLEHVNNIEAGCPAAALGAEIARQDAETKAVFNEGLAEIISLLDQAIEACHAPAVRDAKALMATLTGAVILARGSDDVDVKQSLLTNSKQLLGF